MRKITLVLMALLMVFGLSATVLAADATSYTDVPSTHWAYSSIESCTTKGLMQGVGNNKFDPERLVTRAEIVQTLYNLYGNHVPSDVVDVPRLNDVADDAWYYDAVFWAIGSGISGYSTRPGNSLLGDTDPYVYSFGPNSTHEGRMYAVSFLGKLKDAMDVELPKVVPTVSFPDAESYYLKDAEGNDILSARVDIPEYITAYLYELQQAGIICGYPDGTCRLNEGLTRAEWAKLIDMYTDIEGLNLKP